MANVPTDRRTVVRVLLRVGTSHDSGPVVRRIGGYNVMIVGEAKPEVWPDAQSGDLEGVVWTTPRQVASVVQNLRGCEGVIAARGDEPTDP